MISEKIQTAKLEDYFQSFRKNIIGYNQQIQTPYGSKELIYADWTASGRLYGPIEDRIKTDMGPYVGNTHTESTTTGTMMTRAYQEAHQIIKDHVNAKDSDIIITEGTGMTGMVNKFQRILGLRLPEKFHSKVQFGPNERPVVFVSHMEHHSNHTSWLETIADVECIMPDEDGLLDINSMQKLLDKYKDRETKIASITACSNVTGIQTSYYDVAKLMHQNGGLCFVDFACSAPYVNINMHPDDPEQKLDAIYFSPHKFLGGPGSTGVLIFDEKLYTNKIPDEPGGGTVAWTNPWGEHSYFNDIEIREDGGTPGFLQTIKTALSIQLKEEIGIDNLMAREEEIVKMIFDGLSEIEGLHLLASNNKERLAVFSFYIYNLHYDLATKILNDRFGIQTRSGCSCAGTYGHYLLHISKSVSKKITDEIEKGHLSEKPGWIRMSIHPVMANDEIEFIINSIKQLVINHQDWGKDYVYDPNTNSFSHHADPNLISDKLANWYRPL